MPTFRRIFTTSPKTTTLSLALFLSNPPQYTFILLFVFLLEAIVGGLAYLYETQIELELQTSLNSTFMEQYGVSERQTEAIDRMQQEVRSQQPPDSWVISQTIYLLNSSSAAAARFASRTGATACGCGPAGRT